MPQTSQALLRRNHRKASRHETGLAQLPGGDAALEFYIAVTEFITANRGDPASYAGIVFNATDIRESIPAAEERINAPAEIAVADAPAAEVVAIPEAEVVTIRKADEIDLRHTEAPPRSEKVTGAAGQPADIAESESDATTPAEERDVCGRPFGIVASPAAIHANWPGPPCPVVPIHEPAAIVIRRPAPWLIGLPSPAVIRLPDPLAIAIRSPAGILRGHPHLAVIGNILPLAVGIEVLRAGVVVVCMLPALRVENHVIAALIPFVEVICGWSIRGLILRTIRALNRHELSTVNARAALRFRDFRLPAAYNHLRFGIAIDLNAIVAVAQRMHGGIRSVDFGVSLAVLEDAVIHQALAHLHLNVRGGEVGDFDGRIFVEADGVGVVELNFRPPAIAGRDAVARFQGGIQRGGNPVARVASLYGNVSLDHTKAPHCGLHLRRVLILSLPLVGGILDLRAALILILPILCLRVALIPILRAGRSSYSCYREENGNHCS